MITLYSCMCVCVFIIVCGCFKHRAHKDHNVVEPLRPRDQQTDRGRDHLSLSTPRARAQGSNVDNNGDGDDGDSRVHLTILISMMIPLATRGLIHFV